MNGHMEKYIDIMNNETFTVFFRADVILLFGNNSLTQCRTKMIFGQSIFHTPYLIYSTIVHCQMPLIKAFTREYEDEAGLAN